MPNSSKNDIILVRYPFSDLSGAKVRPAVVVSAPHVSQDIFIVPLTSKTTSLIAGEFPLADWTRAGLNVPTAVKRGLYTIHPWVWSYPWCLIWGNGVFSKIITKLQYMPQLHLAWSFQFSYTVLLRRFTIIASRRENVRLEKF